MVAVRNVAEIVLSEEESGKIVKTLEARAVAYDKGERVSA
jgi:hypothetical protein